MSKAPVQMRHILLATDFSSYTNRAEAMAMHFAKAFGATVTLIHVIEGIPGLEEDDLEDFFTELADRANRRMEDVIARFKAEAVDVVPVIKKGKRWKVIVEAADELAVDLVVVGSHGVFEDGKAYIGTTSHRVFMGTNIPVLAARWDDD